MFEIKSKEIEIVDIDSIIENPDNPNRHDLDQIERLTKIIKHNGFRDPLIISKRSGFLLCGHGRLQCAKNLGYKELPVIKQDFKNEAEEYQFMTAHNEIARWSELDRHAVYTKLEEFPEIDVELLGIEDFEVSDPTIVDLPDLGDGSDPDIQQVTFTLSNEQKDILDEALLKAKNELDCTDGINQNSNGNKLAALCRWYIGS